MNILLDTPFDENANSRIAFDYSGFAHDAEITGNATFHSGRSGYAIHFEGGAYARTKLSVVPLDSNFTISWWSKNKVFAPYSAPDKLLFQFAFSPSEILQVEEPAVMDKWQHFVIKRDGNTCSIFVDGTLKHTLTFVGNPIEWAVKQISTSGASPLPAQLPFQFGSNQAPYFMGDIDQLLIFDEALNPNDISQLEQHNVFYWINDVKFIDDYGVYVSESSGLVDALEMKESVTVDWAGQHGEIIDLDRPRFQRRQIKLKCFMKSNSFIDFTMKTNDFLSNFLKPGTQRLKVEIDRYKPLVYEVYFPNGTNINKKWRESDFIGTFELHLIEPEPVKRVIRFNAKQGNMTARITIKSPDCYNFYFGDGNTKKDVFPEQTTLIEHTYAKEGSYFIIIYGEIDAISDFQHNGILTWNKI